MNLLFRSLLCFTLLHLLCVDISHSNDLFEKLQRTIHMYEEATEETTQRIHKHKYIVENHEIQTPDGYIITAHRIPQGLKNEKINSSKPVLIFPGLSNSAMIYVRALDSIGIFLAEQGYDVWLGNTRGDLRYSKHVHYTQYDSEFWNFGWEELAYYDTTSTIDYILNHTNYDQLILISYSLSTISSFALQSVNPEYNNKVSIHVALAPMAVVPYQVSVVSSLALTQYHKINKWYSTTKDLGKFHSRWFINTMYKLPAMCLTFGSAMCQFIFYIFVGYSPESYAESLGDMAFDMLSGASLKILLHLMQQAKFKSFSRYDYSEDENLKRYGIVSPPAFNLSQITTPTVLIYAINDPGSNPLNVELLSRQMKKAKKVQINITMFTHCDFVWSKNPETKNYLNHLILENINPNHNT